MTTAVALVQAYLQVNGYFTVAEYPLLEVLDRGGARTATDLDILAFRFPRVTCRVGRPNPLIGPVSSSPDERLGVPSDRADMIVGEVKEGPARFNPATRDPLVLEAALVRFGCCPRQHAADLVRLLLKTGWAETPGGHNIRMIAFGSSAPEAARSLTITTEHIVDFLRAHLRRHWSHLRHAQLNQPALAFLALLEKAERARDRSESP